MISSQLPRPNATCSKNALGPVASPWRLDPLLPGSPVALSSGRGRRLCESRLLAGAGASTRREKKMLELLFQIILV